MQALIASLSSVTLAEIGDKTQLLTLFLATRFASKNAIIMAILIATLINHGISAYFGLWLSSLLPSKGQTWLIGLSFIAVGFWLLIPDKEDEDENKLFKYGAFITSFILFSLAEIGDKTQVATVILGANFPQTLQVVIGSTLGMLLANLPMIYAGNYLMQRINLDKSRRLACGLFLLLGVATIALPMLKI
ncbi:putative membrane protein [Marinomonas sp. MED121]|uniref:TMEM165/GDT1 family protein n=1 Tax=Marinomonas sp. MED121 TaxID=314277 RepID=UPI0000690C52|nr:TMEM165/GDT1 family protein [Marinomonas sp. MED121]EAQ64926.1 putative membrane protein [Marinomonas sp. MED121]